MINHYTSSEAENFSLKNNKATDHQVAPKSAQKWPVCIAYGDGAGPDIMEMLLLMMHSCSTPLRVPIRIESVQMGEELYPKDLPYGMYPNQCEMIGQNKRLLKAPTRTPDKEGYFPTDYILRERLGLSCQIIPLVDDAQTITSAVMIPIAKQTLNQFYQHGAGMLCEQHLTDGSAVIDICEQALRWAKQFGLTYIHWQQPENISLHDAVYLQYLRYIDDQYEDIHVTILPSDAELVPQENTIIISNEYADYKAYEHSTSVKTQLFQPLGARIEAGGQCHVFAPLTATSDQPLLLCDQLTAALSLLLHAEGEEDVARHFHHLRINTRKHITTSISDNISSSNELIAQVITQWQEAATPLLSCSIDHCLRLSKPSLDLLPLLPMKTGLVGVDIGIDYHSTSENLKTILKSLCTDGPLQLQYLTYSGHIAWPHLFTQSNPAHAWQARFIASNPEKRIQQTDITTLIQALDTHNIPFTHLHMLQVHHHTLGFSLMNE